MKSVDISVIIPAYNVEKYIQKCIHSVLKSSKSEIEVIVVDDNSSDDTLNKLREIEDSRLSIIALETQGGVSRARNKGIEIASGKYLAFIDADDWIDSQMLQKLFCTAEKYHCDITICNHFIVYPQKKVVAGDIGTDICFQGDDIKQYVEMFMLKGKKEFKPYFPMGQPWGTLFRTDLIKKNNLWFVEGMQYKEDVIFSLYAAHYSSCIVRINNPLYYYNQCNSGSLTTCGLKRGMLPRIELDIEERRKFFNTLKPEDNLFREGLYQHICRTYIRNIVPSCCLDADYLECKNILKTVEYSEAFKRSNKSYNSKAERIIIFLINHKGLWLYYFLIWIYTKFRKQL